MELKEEWIRYRSGIERRQGKGTGREDGGETVVDMYNKFKNDE